MDLRCWTVVIRYVLMRLTMSARASSEHRMSVLQAAVVVEVAGMAAVQVAVMEIVEIEAMVEIGIAGTETAPHAVVAETIDDTKTGLVLIQGHLHHDEPMIQGHHHDESNKFPETWVMAWMISECLLLQVQLSHSIDEETVTARIPELVVLVYHGSAFV